MSTDLRCMYHPRGSERLIISASLGGAVITTEGSSSIDASRADFLKAVADELDVIVIERSELPEVEASDVTIYPLRTRPSSAWGGGLSHVQATGPNSPNGSPEWHRNRAMAHLALAEYLDANPPTDPKVEALATMIERHAKAGMFSGQEQQDAFAALELARQVIATGRVEVTP